MQFRVGTTLLLLLVTTVALVPQLAFAQFAPPAGGFKGGFDAVEAARAAAGVKDFGTLGNFILAVLATVAALVAVLALVALVWGAVMYITSLGDESRIEKAKKIILYALLGLLVLGVAGIAVNVVINLIRT